MGCSRGSGNNHWDNDNCNGCNGCNSCCDDCNENNCEEEIRRSYWRGYWEGCRSCGGRTAGSEEECSK